jgi:tellurite resistance protein TerC
MVLWTTLAVTVVLAIGVDLFAHRGAAPDGTRRALLWSGLWILVAMAFAALVAHVLGANAGVEFLSAYFLEMSLSADNLMVFMLIFAELAVPPEHQRRVLFWGIGGAIVFRGAFIGVGAQAVLRWHFILYGFGVLLVLLGIKLFRGSETAEGEPGAVLWLRTHLPFSAACHDRLFFVREEGHWRLTRLAIALVTIEVCDVTFAFDSVPSAFSVSRSVFVLYSSNLMAILGLRSLFVVLAHVLARLRYLRYGLGVILCLAGVKLVGSPWIHLPAIASLLVVVGCLAATAVASLLAAPKA